MDNMNNVSRIHWLLLLVISGLLGIILLPYASGFPSLIVEDDGFFYAQIAKNIALHGFSSFDGLHETSGYHLLWMGFMASMAWVLTLFHSSPEFLLWGYLSLSLFIIALYAFLFFEKIELVLLVYVLSLMCSLLMEVNLLVLLLLPIYATLIQMYDSQKTGAPVWLYALIFLVPLVRIDSTVMLAIPLFVIFIQQRALGLRLGLALLAGLAAQLILMQLIFGNPFSVSSELKAGGAGDPRLISNLFYRGDDYLLRNLVAIGLIVMALGLSVAKRHWMMAAIVVSVAGFYTAHLVFIDQRHWYFLPVYIPTLYVIVRLWPQQRPWSLLLRPGATVSAFIIAFGFGLLYQLTHIPARINSLVFIKQVEAMLDENEVVFQDDGSGWSGFFLSAHLVNGDGLVNSYEYARRIRAGELSGYLDEIGAGYIIVNKPSGTNRLVDRGGLVVTEDEVELILQTPLDSDYRFTQFELYRRQN